jgi:predicted dehydrogenase
VSGRVGVGVVGCGLIGRRRALDAARYEHSRCLVVADPRRAAAVDVASATGAESTDDWRRLVDRRDVDVVVVATPNGLLAEITSAALEAGKHVLMEKPMGKSLQEAQAILATARRSGKVLKVGFNHRYHPALAEAHRRYGEGEIGRLVNIRARYGHGARSGYENEWRGDPAMAGGGELTDQGVHLLDLIYWFAGVPQHAFAYLQSAVWSLGGLEDNAFGLLKFQSGAVASLHASLTQWKNLFSFELFGDQGALSVEGLGKSYGPETFTAFRRRREGGAPDSDTRSYPGEDESWRLEWADFLGAVVDNRPMLGTADDGVVVMRMLDALYRSAATQAPVEV